LSIPCSLNRKWILVMLFVCLFEPYFIGSSIRHVYSLPELKQEKVGRCLAADQHHFILWFSVRSSCK
jgi:hypothetical protein